MRDGDLSDEQRTWMPPTAWDAYGQWPCASKVELADRLEFLTDAGGWDWRSVAVAARAYPEWRVELRGEGFLTITPPRGQDPTDARAVIRGAPTPAAPATVDRTTTRLKASRTVLAWFAEAITGAWICLVVALNGAFRDQDALVVGTLLLAAGMIVLMRLDARREYHRGWSDSRLHSAVQTSLIRRDGQPPGPTQTPPEPWQRTALLATAVRTAVLAASSPSDDADHS
ncbi:hypothetical protein ACT17Q_15645 [Cellulomonas sp. CW35]|uniref:hypothetical protein n=1 Tax=Cellulomonas sp. CW35 TaxID=3458249 RepID=UPI0040333E29